MKKILTGLLLFINLSWGQEFRLNASVDRNKIGLGEPFTFTIEISATGISSLPDPQLPNLDKFGVVGGPFQSTQFQMTSGGMSVSKTISYSLVPREIGKLEISSVILIYKGKTYQTNPIQIEIVKGSTQPPSQPQGRGIQVPPASTAQDLKDNLFLRCIPDKKVVYQNEPIVVVYKIYFRVSITQYDLLQLPTASGFWVENFPVPNRPNISTETYNGKQYNIAEIKRMVIFPTTTGKLTLNPMEIAVDVKIQKRRSDDFFDDFFNDFGGSQKFKISTSPMSFEVRPLPKEKQPDSFAGAVGNFQFSTQVDKKEASTNDAITLKAKISGRGNIKMLVEPKFQVPPEFEKYEPKISEDIQREGSDVSGNKSFEYVLIPRLAGQYTIQPVEFSYFDPRTESYKRFRSEPISIQVKKGREDLVPTSGLTLSREEVKLIGQDIRFIKKSNSKFTRWNYFVYQNPVFILWVVFPLVGILVVFLYRQHQDRISGDVAYARLRRAGSLATRRLKKAKSTLHIEKQKEFFAETSRALLGFIGDKLNIHEAGVLTDEVEILLRQKKVSAETIQSYLELVRQCDYQRFAPANSTIREMKELYHQAEEAIQRLEKEI